MRTLFEPMHSPQWDSASAPATDTPFLDFLYPPEALAFMRRASWRAEHRRRPDQMEPPLATRTRHFTSTAQHAQDHPETVQREPIRGDAPLDALSSITESSKPSDEQLHLDLGAHATPFDDDSGWLVRSNDHKDSPDYQERALRDYERVLKLSASHDARGSYDAIWRSWSALTDDLRSDERADQVAGILSTSDRPTDARRLIHIMSAHTLNVNRTVSLYREMVAHHVLGEFEQAVSSHAAVLEELSLSNTPSSTVQATEYLMTGLLAAHQWTHLVSVFRARRDLDLDYRRERFHDENRFRRNLESVLAASPNYTQNFLAYLVFMKASPETTKSKKFVSTMVYLLEVGLSSQRLNGFDFGPHATLEIVKETRDMGLGKRQFYEGAINLSWQWQKTEVGLTRFQVLQKAKVLYQLYKSDAGQFEPTEGLMRSLLGAAMDVSDHALVQELVEDWDNHLGPVRGRFAASLMWWHAGRGEFEALGDVFNTVSSQSAEVTWDMLHPLLHVDAMRADAQGAEDRLRWIRETFQLEPDTIAYNIVQHAYFRADDYDGIMTAFSRTFESGVTPDAYTFGTVMALTAARGDVDLTERFRRMALSYDITDWSVINSLLVYAHIRNDDTETAERLVEEFSETYRSQDKAIPPRMWAHLLTFHATHGTFQEAIRLSKRMLELGIAFDESCYGALMIGFVDMNQMPLAEQTMARMINTGGLQPWAYHFAILISGCAREMKFEKGLRLYSKMLSMGIESELSTRIALLELTTIASQTRYFIDLRSHPGVRFDIPEELMEEFLSDENPQRMAATKQPLGVNRRMAGNTDIEAYYVNVLFQLYKGYENIEAAEMLLQRYEDVRRRRGEHAPIKSLMVLQWMMSVSARQRKYEEVESLWQLAKQRAFELVTTGRSGQRQLPVSSRGILRRALNIYVSALQASDQFGRILKVFRETIQLGLDLDYTNWNLYVQILARRGKSEEAFAVCEKNLIRGFPGWNREETRPTLKILQRRKSQGLKYYAKVDDEFLRLRPGSLVVTYKTMTRLLHTYRKLEQQAYQSRPAQTALDEIHSKAPRTVDAVLSMPVRRQHDKYARSLFGGSITSPHKAPGFHSNRSMGTPTRQFPPWQQASPKSRRRRERAAATEGEAEENAALSAEDGSKLEGEASSQEESTAEDLLKETMYH